jgi:hypothetical protein
MNEPAPRVIFLHIGKTAGSTLRQVIRRNYRASEILKAQVPGGPREATLQHITRFPEQRRASARLVMGHTIYGIHEMLPGPSTYITVVRDPFKLILSQYLFVLRRPQHRLHGRVTSGGMSLVDYVRNGLSPELDNGQTRAIAGDISTPIGQCNEDMLRTAKRNIEAHFSVAGVTEWFDEMLIVLRNCLGWSHLCYVRANVAPDPISIKELPTEAVRLVEERTALDRELYAFIRRLFQDQVAAITGFDRQLRRLRRLNRVYRPWGSLTYSIPKRARLRLRRREAAPGLASPRS